MEVVLWAFLTGGITGGVFVAIVLKARHRRAADDYEALLQDNAQHQDELERVTRKMQELEERVDSTEHHFLEQQRKELPPP